MTEATDTTAPANNSWLNRTLDWIERAGNKLPDPAILFFIFLLLTWGFSALLAGVEFAAVDPRSVRVESTVARLELTPQFVVQELSSALRDTSAILSAGAWLATRLRSSSVMTSSSKTPRRPR